MVHEVLHLLLTTHLYFAPAAGVPEHIVQSDVLPIEGAGFETDATGLLVASVLQMLLTCLFLHVRRRCRGRMGECDA
ncbi:MAG: hypothetical protein E7001_01205 [Coriobacteriaceae bacterium]|nr:hypothetical protein [Coriobacteriaceae bacterium]